jgi:glutathione S-transferase
MQIFFARASCVSRHIAIVHPASSLPSLDRRLDRAQNARSVQHISGAASTLVINPVHRFEESIAGRHYLIEVAPVSADRWRACIVRLPGVPTALMPFYGETPDEAAKHLTDWLSRAYQRAGATTG